MTLAGLQALRTALATNDPALLQGATTSPPPLESLMDCPVLACCPVAYAGWRGEGLTTVAQVENAFFRLCNGVDALLNEQAAVRWFLTWWDEYPKEQTVPQLLGEVEREITSRQSVARDPSAPSGEPIPDWPDDDVQWDERWGTVFEDAPPILVPLEEGGAP
jgi:hypothetical protein